tara:strand:+ start:327 stop:1175 length:849 start_codon:yes stop_codon:yes gene_type:complete
LSHHAKLGKSFRRLSTVFEILSPGTTPFAQISWGAIGTIALIYFGSFFIRGTFGFGSGVPAILLGSYILEPHHAVLLLLTCSSISHVQFIWHGVRHADWGVAWVILVFLIPGVIGGVWVFRELSAAWLTLVLGVVITAIVAISFTDVMVRLEERVNIRSPWICGTLATLSGWIAGAVGAGANYLTVAYLRHACPTAAKLRATGFTLSTVSIIGRIIVTSIAGLISPQIIAETIVLAPVVITGGWMGARFFRALPGARVDQVFRVFLLLVAISVIGKGIVQVT